MHVHSQYKYPHLPVPYKFGTSCLIYWQLGAWFQIYRELENEGIATKQHGLYRYDLYYSTILVTIRTGSYVVCIIFVSCLITSCIVTNKILYIIIVSICFKNCRFNDFVVCIYIYVCILVVTIRTGSYVVCIIFVSCLITSCTV